MNILLDTHIAIWALNDDEALPPKARKLILDPDNLIYYSTVSTWEILLKHSRDPSNLELSADLFVAYCDKAGFLPGSQGTRDQIVRVAQLRLPGLGNQLHELAVR